MVKYKSYLQSKTFWALVVAVLVAIYDAVAPLRHWPAIPAEIFAVLTAMGIWGVRTADSTILLPGQKPPAQPDNVVPTLPADPTPVSLPAPVEAAPAPKDPDMLTLMTLLSGALSLGSTPATPGQSSALGTWVDTWLPKLKADVQVMGTGLNAVNLLVLARDVIPAANQLAGVFAGTDRAEVAAITLRFAVQQFAPPAVVASLTPLLASGTVEGLIESVYRELFPVPVTPPVVNAPELPSGEAIQ